MWACGPKRKESGGPGRERSHSDVGVSPGSAFSGCGAWEKPLPFRKPRFPHLRPRESCPEFAGLWWGRHEAPLREHVALGRVCGPSDSYQKLIISTVLGLVPGIALLFPTSLLQSTSWESVLATARLLSNATAHLLQTAFPRLLCQGEPVGSSGGRLGSGRSQGIPPYLLCLVGAGEGGARVIFPALAAAFCVFSACRTTLSSAVQVGGGSCHDSNSCWTVSSPPAFVPPAHER